MTRRDARVQRRASEIRVETRGLARIDNCGAVGRAARRRRRGRQCAARPRPHSTRYERAPAARPPRAAAVRARRCTVAARRPSRVSTPSPSSRCISSTSLTCVVFLCGSGGGGGGSMFGDVNISSILDSFSISYDKRVRPNYGG